MDSTPPAGPFASRPPADARMADPLDPADPAPERRSRLRLYQVQLLERMQAAKSGAAVAGRELGVMIGGRRCLLDLTQISEIVPRQSVTPVPLARSWYLGLANIRGNLTGVVDLALYQAQAQAPEREEREGDSESGEGEDAAEAAPRRRFITFAPALGFNCALVAERVLGLRRQAEMAPVPGLNEAPAWNGRRLRDAEGRQWTVLDLALLVREPRFLQVGW